MLVLADSNSSPVCEQQNGMHTLASFRRSIYYLALILGVGLLCFLDYLTGIELNFFVFYFLPVSIAAFMFGLMPAVAISVLCAGGWAIADIMNNHVYSTPVFAVWNTLIRLIAFLSIGWAVSTITALLDKERSLSSQLRETLAEIKVLTGLLPICAGCKKIREGDGSWKVLEQYMEKHSTVQFTHSLCPDCARLVLEDAGITPKPE